MSGQSLAERVVAGDPVELFVPDTASPQQRAQIREKFGLDKPLGEQFTLYLSSAVRGDLGESIFTGRPVTDDLREVLFPPQPAGVTAEGAYGRLEAAVFGLPSSLADVGRRPLEDAVSEAADAFAHVRLPGSVTDYQQ